MIALKFLMTYRDSLRTCLFWGGTSIKADPWIGPGQRIVGFATLWCSLEKKRFNEKYLPNGGEWWWWSLWYNSFKRNTNKKKIQENRWNIPMHRTRMMEMVKSTCRNGVSSHLPTLQHFLFLTTQLGGTPHRGRLREGQRCLLTPIQLYTWMSQEVSKWFVNWL